MINLCIPVLTRYDLLRALLCSLDASTVPARVHIIDNGRNERRLTAAISDAYGAYDVFTPVTPMSIIEGWNWFIENVEEERVIVENDILFSPDSIAQLTAGPGDLVSAEGLFPLSCFIIRDGCIRKTGLLDEASLDRVQEQLDGAGVVQSVVICGISRGGSFVS